MVIIAIISLTIGLILEREQAFYENQPVANVGVTVPPSQTLAEEAGEQAESLVQAGHSAHELAIIAERWREEESVRESGLCGLIESLPG